MTTAWFDWQSLDGWRRIKLLMICGLAVLTFVAFRRITAPIDLIMERHDIKIHQSLTLSGRSQPFEEVVIKQRSTDGRTPVILAQIHCDEAGSFTTAVQPMTAGSTNLVAVDSKGQESAPGYLYVHTEGESVPSTEGM